MSMKPLLIEREGAVARLVLNRPEQGNAINLELARALVDATRQLAEEGSVRCVVLTGTGRLFCAGGDITAFAASPEGRGRSLRQLADTLHDAVRSLATMPKPLVVVVNGPAAGAGLSLAMLGDIVLAGASAHFTAAYASVGLSPDGGMSWLLPRLVGLRRAQEIVLANRRIGAEEAVSIGLVTRIVADTDLAAEAAAVAERMVAAPTEAIGAARRLLLEAPTRSLSDHLDIEAASIAAAGERSEAREGIAAFLERRKPNFSGA